MLHSRTYLSTYKEKFMPCNIIMFIVLNRGFVATFLVPIKEFYAPSRILLTSQPNILIAKHFVKMFTWVDVYINGSTLCYVEGSTLLMLKEYYFYSI